MRLIWRSWYLRNEILLRRVMCVDGFLWSSTNSISLFLFVLSLSLSNTKKHMHATRPPTCVCAIYQSRSIAPPAIHPFTKDMLPSSHKPNHHHHHHTTTTVDDQGNTIVVRHTRVPLSVNFNRSAVPYLELLHSSLLPVSNLWSDTTETNERCCTFLSCAVYNTYIYISLF
jgi:hypothetical protein